MSLRERIRSAWRAFWNSPTPTPNPHEWLGYCMIEPRCYLDAGHSGRCDWV